MRLTSQNNLINPLLNGSLTLTFSGDEVLMRTDDLCLVYEYLKAETVQSDAGKESVIQSFIVDEHWTETMLTARISEDGERSLSGRARLSNAESSGTVLFDFDTVTAPTGETIPASGTLALTHTDNSRLNILFDQSTNKELVYTRTSSGRVTTSHTILWSELDTRVPLPLP